MKALRRIFVVISKLLNQKHDSKIYKSDFDNHAQQYDSVVTRELLGKETEKLINEIEIHDGMRCLDLGCGTGHATGLIYKRIKPDGVILGCDVSTPMLDIAKEKFENSAKISFLKKDMLETLQAQKEDSLDLIASFWSLGYSEWMKVLQEMKRVIVDGGNIAVLVNTQASLSELQNLVTKIIIRNPFVLKSIPPINFPSNINSFHSFIKRLNLKVIKLSEGSCEQSFASGETFVSWMKTAGPCAGFRGALRDSCRENVFKRIKNLINDMGGIKLTFRFIRFVGTK